MRGNGRAIASILFLAGLAALLVVLFNGLPFGGAPMQIGQDIASRATEETGSHNIVTAILLVFRGFDTLGEVTVLFVAATTAAMVLSGAGRDEAQAEPAGFVFGAGVHLLFPFLVLLGGYIIVHGHLTTGGGFQGGAILAVAFFLPFLANPAGPFNERTVILVEGFAGLAFVLIASANILDGGAFLAGLFGGGVSQDTMSLWLLQLFDIAIGLKVGSDLAGLMTRMVVVGDKS